MTLRPGLGAVLVHDSESYVAPSCGFGEYLRGRNPAFDQHSLDADAGLDPAGVVVRTLDPAS